jgi:hypothetical protein
MTKLTFYFTLLSLTAFLQVSAQLSEVLTTRKWNQLKANVSLVGLGANLEHSIGEQTTINFEAGVNFGFSYSKSAVWGSNWGYILSPAVSGELRHYYGLRRRVARDKATRNNAGNFLSFTTGYKALPIWSKYINDSPVLYLVPAWGMQRSWGKRINFEARFGPAVKYTPDTDNWTVSPNIRLNVGYVIF